ncbi:TetR/AcrR family transcriptional regulator [Corynebacterium sp.]|uniref:TetR/AcrR family transcriptional regulator n=1 Tax=Corynebacterium sp. TaxID=1720 RepID=UPI0028A6CC5C|nr:TetR/AcrR family transcriptional regulator [Corynebacterium sp.]
MTEARNESTQSAVDCGLRERKRRETRLRIEDCATALILEHGFHQVTIDEICEKAEVSRRTFFNYFDSKDQVAAGRGVPPIPAADLEAFATTDSSNIIRDVLDYIGKAVDNDPDSSPRLSPDRATSLAVRERRRQIVQETPELSAAGMRRFDALAGDILAAITAFLTRFPEHRRLPDVTVHQESLQVTALIRTALATGSIFHREQPELTKWEVLTHSGRHLTALAANYSHGWD